MNNNKMNSEPNIEDSKLKQSYQDYMNNYQVDNDLHQRLLNIPAEASRRKAAKVAKFKRFSRMAASVCILIVSVAVLGSLIFFGDFMSSNDAKKSSDHAIENAAEEPKAETDFDTSYGEHYDADNVAEIPAEAPPEKTMASYKDLPVPLSGNAESTYTQFCITFDKNAGQSNSNTSGADKADTNSGNDQGTLQNKLPSALSENLELVEESLRSFNNMSALSMVYQSQTNGISGRLLVNVHPIYDFEMDQLVSVENIEKYSLNPSDNTSLPDSYTKYSSTLLYPIFTAESLNRNVIASRVYSEGDSSTISFGVYQDGYVITYDAMNLTADELVELLLQ